jgi:hypothetical protein
MIESEAKKFLRSEKRHARLLGGAVAFSLIAFHACSNEIRRRAFATLRTGKNMIEGEIFGVFMITAILASIPVADVDASPLHSCLATVSADMDVVPQANDGRHWEDSGRRMKNVVAVVFFDEYRAAKPKADSTSYSDCTQRLV